MGGEPIRNRRGEAYTMAGPGGFGPQCARCNRGVTGDFLSYMRLDGAIERFVPSPSKLNEFAMRIAARYCRYLSHPLSKDVRGFLRERAKYEIASKHVIPLFAGWTKMQLTEIWDLDEDEIDFMRCRVAEG